MAPRNQAAVLARKSRKRKAEEKLSPLGVIAPPPIQIECPKFTGSLAMLFECVRDRKVDLLDVPLLPICEAYFHYLLSLPKANLDEAAAALAALAYLLERKSWLLLPSPDPEPELEEPLGLPPPSTAEYQVALEALAVWKEERERVFFRPGEAGPDPYELPFELGDVSPLDLARALERLLRKAQPEPLEQLNRPRKSLSEQIGIVYSMLTREWQNLENLIPEPFTREEAVYSFLALLELIRLGQATLRLYEDSIQFARKS